MVFAFGCPGDKLSRFDLISTYRCNKWRSNWNQLLTKKSTQRTLMLLPIHRNLVLTQEYCYFSMCFCVFETKRHKKAWKTHENKIPVLTRNIFCIGQNCKNFSAEITLGSIKTRKTSCYIIGPGASWPLLTSVDLRKVTSQCKPWTTS